MPPNIRLVNPSLPTLNGCSVCATSTMNGRIASDPFGELLIERVDCRETYLGRRWFANESSDTVIKRGTIDEDVGL